MENAEWEVIPHCERKYDVDITLYLLCLLTFPFTIIVFLDVMLCHLVDRYQFLRGRRLVRWAMRLVYHTTS